MAKRKDYSAEDLNSLAQHLRGTLVQGTSIRKNPEEYKLQVKKERAEFTMFKKIFVRFIAFAEPKLSLLMCKDDIDLLKKGKMCPEWSIHHIKNLVFYPKHVNMAELNYIKNGTFLGNKDISPNAREQFKLLLKSNPHPYTLLSGYFSILLKHHPEMLRPAFARLFAHHMILLPHDVHKQVDNEILKVTDQAQNLKKTSPKKENLSRTYVYMDWNTLVFLGEELTVQETERPRPQITQAYNQPLKISDHKTQGVMKLLEKSGICEKKRA